MEVANKVKYLSVKGCKIFMRSFMPFSNIRAVMHINHGMAEHSGRYAGFIRYLLSHNLAVYIHDHPGHGNSSEKIKDLGVIPSLNGWNIMLEAIHKVNKYIRKKHPDVPVFLFGHSMGSLLARHYNAMYPVHFQGIILSGTTFSRPSLLYPALKMVQFLKLFHHSSFKHNRLNKLFYRQYSQAISNSKTRFDWLSSNPEEVNKYITDPKCGFNLSLAFYENLLKGSINLYRAEKELKFRKNLPILIIAGKGDPVGSFGKDPEQLYNLFLQQSFIKVQLSILEGRHELLNEKINIVEQFRDRIRSFVYKSISEE